MHPIEDIRGTKSDWLAGKRIVLGITGSIAAVECVKLARELARHGAEVIPVMSEAATRIVHPDAIHFATGHEPIVKLDGAVKHVEMCGNSGGKADLLLIAPATANTISKMAWGIDDTPVTTMATTAIGSGMKVMVVPAMHSSMYEHPVVMENVEKLKDIGVRFVGPVMEENKAKMASIGDIVRETCRLLGPGDLSGKRVLVIGGSTREHIDGVRFITNSSSGSTALALASEAYRRGAEVEAWLGQNVEPGGPWKVRRFTSVSNLERMARSARADIILVPAAISDFTVKAARGKLDSGEKLELRLEPAPKILALLRKAGSGVLVGFKAEVGVTQKVLEARARARLEEHGLDMIVANRLEDVGPDSTKALILTDRKRVKFSGKKAELAARVFDMLAG